MSVLRGLVLALFLVPALGLSQKNVTITKQATLQSPCQVARFAGDAKHMALACNGAVNVTSFSNDGAQVGLFTSPEEGESTQLLVVNDTLLLFVTAFSENSGTLYALSWPGLELIDSLPLPLLMEGTCDGIGCTFAWWTSRDGDQPAIETGYCRIAVANSRISVVANSTASDRQSPVRFNGPYGLVQDPFDEDLLWSRQDGVNLPGSPAGWTPVDAASLEVSSSRAPLVDGNARPTVHNSTRLPGPGRTLPAPSPPSGALGGAAAFRVGQDTVLLGPCCNGAFLVTMNATLDAQTQGAQGMTAVPLDADSFAYAGSAAGRDLAAPGLTAEHILFPLAKLDTSQLRTSLGITVVSPADAGYASLDGLCSAATYVYEQGVVSFQGDTLLLACQYGAGEYVVARVGV